MNQQVLACVATQPLRMAFVSAQSEKAMILTDGASLA